MNYSTEKFEKPYLAITIRHETRDMSVGHVEKEYIYLSTDRLVPGEKLPVPEDCVIYGDYTVLEIGDKAIKLSRDGSEFCVEKDAAPETGASCGGSNAGGVYGSTKAIFEYRTPLSRKEINKIPEMALDAAECTGSWVEKSNRHIDVLELVERAVREGNTGMYVALALLTASGRWETCKIHRPEKFREIFTEGLRKGALAPNIDNPAWEWMDYAIVSNDPGEFTDDMDLYYDALATATENGIWLARDIMDMIWEPENCQEED